MAMLAIVGSRNKAGQTARAAEALVRAAGGDGNHVEVIFLPAMNIERCRQCDERGWGKCRSEGRCVIEDDFQAVTEKVIAADATIFATPVYFSDLSESMRAYLDRLRRIMRHESARGRIENRAAVGICVAGGGGGGAPACTVSLENALQTCGFDVLDMVPARRQNLRMKIETLAVTGRWLGEQLFGRRR